MTEHRADAVALQQLLSRGQVSPLELVDDAIAKIETLNPALNAVVSTDFDRARARAADPSLSGPFAGVPILLKDSGAERAGERLPVGSRLAHAVAAPPAQDSYLLRRLLSAGFIPLGRTNVPEFCTSGTTETGMYGPARNPYDPSRTPGGSSGGSAAAVAAGMVPLAHGSDGAGSIRCPASCCGLVGLKPSRGLVSDGPQRAYGWLGLATQGVLTRTVRDTAALLDVVAGPAPGDPVAVLPEPGGYLQASRAKPRRLRVGVYLGRSPQTLHPQVRAAVEATLAALEPHHTITEAFPAALEGDTLESTRRVRQAVTLRAAVADLADQAGRPVVESDLNPWNWYLLSKGEGLTDTDVLRTLDAWNDFSRACAMFWASADDGGSGYDLLVTPTLDGPALPLGEMVFDPQDPEAGYARLAAWCPFTGWANITGQPAVSLPVQVTPQGLPVGVQLVARTGADALLLSVAAQLEEHFRWFDRFPGQP